MSLNRFLFPCFILISLFLSDFASSQSTLPKDEGIITYKISLYGSYVICFVSVYNLVLSCDLDFFAVDILRAIATTLKKSNWNFSVDPCDVTSSDGGWRNLNASKGCADAVTCKCTSTGCHVTSVFVSPLLLFINFIFPSLH